MKTTYCAIVAVLLLAAGTGCQTCGPCGGPLGGCGDMCGDSCGSACGCGDACGSICGGMCGGNCGGGLLDGMGPGRRIGAGISGGVGVVGGALGGLHGPTPGNPRMAGDFNWQGRHQARHAPPVAEPGPQTAAYTYPYYTTRGPRDFFMNNPPSIGR